MLDLVMLLTLCAVISFTFLEINTFTVNYKNRNTQNAKLFQNTTNDIDIGSGSLVTIISNTIKTPNLKYNIFDRMLSNEMLSIKQHLFDKNSTYASSVYISLQNNVPTPTLELKQKWPIEKILLKSKIGQQPSEHTEVKKKITIYSPSSSITANVNPELDSENENSDYTNNKIIEVRSFSNMPVHHTKNPSILRQKPICTCMKTNEDTCSQHCTATSDCSRSKRVCTHTDEYKTCQSECTRTTLNNIMSIASYPFYPSYFLGVPTEAPNMYYQPDVINELKLPKHKHRHSNKLPSNYRLVENDDSKEENYYYEENEKIEYMDPDIIEYENKKHRKCKHKNKQNLIQSENFNTGHLHVVDQDRFIEEVVEDLKAYYSDAVAKDCYCSFSTIHRKYHYKIIISFTFVFFIIV